MFLNFKTCDLWAKPCYLINFFILKKQPTITKIAKEQTFIVPSENIYFLATAYIPGSITGCRRRCCEALRALNTNFPPKKATKKLKLLISKLLLPLEKNNKTNERYKLISLQCLAASNSSNFHPNIKYRLLFLFLTTHFTIHQFLSSSFDAETVLTSKRSFILHADTKKKKNPGWELYPRPSRCEVTLL